ncbi:MAG: CAP domain-containing protein, partial [Chloroflexota bacterium]
ANEFGETIVQQPIKVNPGPLYLFLPLVRASIAGENIATDPALAPAIEPQGDEASSGEAPGGEAPNEELPLLELPTEIGQAEQLLAYLNEARRVNGLAPLNQVHELSIAAQSHADDMADSGLTGHAGSDGSVPALRIQLSGYPGGYAGEATAWGMPEAVEPVRFWLSSPGHRPIILNPAATDVGVGFSENMASPSVWYWTAEFASLNLPVIRVPLPEAPEPDPVINLLGPPRDSEFLLSTDTDLIFTWTWPKPLEPDERFAVYVKSRGRVLQLGTVRQTQSDDQYQFEISAANVPVLPGQQQWHIRLEETHGGGARFESEAWPITFRSAQ